MPPRQVQQAFEEVDKALSSRNIAVSKATSLAQSLFLTTAGPDYAMLSDAVQAEFDVLRQASAVKGDASKLNTELAQRRMAVEKLLVQATGDVRNIIKKAQIKHDQTIKEAAGDYDQFMSEEPRCLSLTVAGGNLLRRPRKPRNRQDVRARVG
jgi:hypothetical protein